MIITHGSFGGTIQVEVTGEALILDTWTDFFSFSKTFLIFFDESLFSS